MVSSNKHLFNFVNFLVFKFYFSPQSEFIILHFLFQNTVYSTQFSLCLLPFFKHMQHDLASGLLSGKFFIWLSPG